MWLGACAKGEHGGLFAYQPYREPSRSMTAVGLLCRQYLGATADAPNMIEGDEYLREHPPINSDATPAGHLLLVLRHAGDVQPRRSGMGRVEPRDAPHADRDAVQGRLCGGELGPGAADAWTPGG